MPSAKYQIFISSTYEDLREERDQVIRAVLEMGHIPVGMEMFSAADEEQWQIIARHIEESDYYVVIVAHRLGSLADAGVSFTRKEYEYARQMDIPCLGFLLDEKASWPADRVDTGTATRKALGDFKSLVREKPVSFWSTADDLHGKFSIALMKAFTAKPREGWVRASTVAGPEVTNELIRLSSENADLRARLSKAEAKAQKDKLAELQQTVTTLFATKRTPSYRYFPGGDWQEDAEVSLFEVFLWLGPEMMVEGTVTEMSRTLAMSARTDREKDWDVVAHNQLREIFADFMTLGLIQPSTRKHTVSDANEYWSLSSYGVDVLKRVRTATLKKHLEERPKVDETPDGRHSNSEEARTDGPSPAGVTPVE